MALYDYKCSTCNQVHTVEHPISEDPTITCGTCGTPMRKLYAAPAVTFKGNGWGHQ